MTRAVASRASKPGRAARVKTYSPQPAAVDPVQHSDPHVRKLAEFFSSHPTWVVAARNVADGASSRVHFSHIPEQFQLVRRDGKSWLLPGEAADPDFAFRFTPAAIDRITSVDGDVGDFAVALFRAIVDRNPGEQVGFRVVAPFRRLLVRGYVTLLVRSGPKVLRYGAEHGVGTIGELRRFVSQTRVSDPRWRDL